MTKADRRLRLEGLEPDNLLASLALLGLLRTLEAARPDWRPRAAWDLDDPPLRPVLVLSGSQTPGAICEAAADGAALLAEYYVFPQNAAGGDQKDLNYTETIARELLIQAAHQLDSADVWSALMCDAAAKDGKIEATPFCLLFGQGHQHFLDRLAQVPRIPAPPPRGRGKAAVTLTAADTLHEALFEEWKRADPTPGFRWDPAEDVRYALRAMNPSDEKSTTQHGANRLAALGLTALTAVPVQRGERVRLRVLGGHFERNEFFFYWPVWKHPASLSAIRALIGHPELRKGPAAVAHLGVVEVRCTRRISVGKYMNFARASPVSSVAEQNRVGTAS
ncbi:MAG TPA: hypothetical protein VH684_01170 [Xanthobacteraceae bacterium]|jgi:hypothetical protein